MADIELVIKIPEETANEIRDNAMFAYSISSVIRWDVTSAIVNGIPLPKGHGRLIEASEVVKAYALEKKTNALCGDDDAFIETIKHAQTIIEADKESEK